jgi:hypothetical protein
MRGAAGNQQELVDRPRRILYIGDLMAQIAGMLPAARERLAAEDRAG